MGAGLYPLQSIADAFAAAEGYGKSGAIPTTANNPGDLKLGDIGYGTSGSGITNFPTSDAGNTALLSQLNLMASGKSAYYSPDESLTDIGTTWSGGDPNWAQTVASKLGVSPASTLGQLLGTQAPTSSAAGGVSTAAAPASSSSFISQAKNFLEYLLSGGLLGSNPLAPAGSSEATPYTITDGVFIVLGIALIIVGALSFERTREVVGNVANGVADAAKTAGKVAEIAA